MWKELDVYKRQDLYSGATYTVGSDKTVAVTIPAAKDGGTVILTEVKKTKDPGKTEMCIRDSV